MIRSQRDSWGASLRSIFNLTITPVPIKIPTEYRIRLWLMAVVRHRLINTTLPFLFSEVCLMATADLLAGKASPDTLRHRHNLYDSECWTA